MLLPELLSSMRVELHDTGTTPVFEDEELNRGVLKTCSLMSRLLPRRLMTETYLVRTITSEALTIATSTGTLAYKPIRKGSLTITGKVVDVDYRVNLVTGVITEIGARLTDGAYVATYELDTSMLDLSTLLTDCIKLERVEYPAGNTPPTFPTFDQYGDMLVLRANNVLAENEKLRLIYLARWTPPTPTVSGNYPSHLNDAVIIGSVGQTLIYRAEYYVQQAGSVLATLTPPTAYVVVKPTSPTMPVAPTAPTAPTLTYTDFDTAIALVSTEILAAKAHITSGAALVNVAPRGADPAGVYAKYADSVFSAANTRVNEALAQLRKIEEDLGKYQAQVTSYGSDVNAYANNISGLTGIHRTENEIESSEVANYTAQVNKYIAQIQEQDMKAKNYLEVAGRYLASGQSKINEFLIMIGLRTEFNMNKASAEQRG